VTPIRCVCGNWLGVLHPDRRVEVRHRGRRLIGRVDEIVCEHCSEVWRNHAEEKAQGYAADAEAVETEPSGAIH
jgi:hypothetical protein